jgi:Mor family transcriptional regulator
VKEIQTAMLVSVFVFNIPDFLFKKLSQLIIEEERQRKLTEGIKDSQEVLGAVVLRMSELFAVFMSNGIKFYLCLGRAYRRSESNPHVFQDSYKYESIQSLKIEFTYIVRTVCRLLMACHSPEKLSLLFELSGSCLCFP